MLVIKQNWANRDILRMLPNDFRIESTKTRIKRMEKSSDVRTNRYERRHMSTTRLKNTRHGILPKLIDLLVNRLRRRTVQAS